MSRERLPMRKIRDVLRLHADNMAKRKLRSVGSLSLATDTTRVKARIGSMEISRAVAPGACAVLLMDRAGWHNTGEFKMPKNIIPIFLPSRSPELNPVENIWQFMRDNWLSNRIFEDYEAIVGAALVMPGCASWRGPGKSCPSECGNGRSQVNH